MALTFDYDPDQALDAAKHCGWLVVPAVAEGEEWEDACCRWEQRCHDKGPAAIALFVDRSGRGRMVFAAPPAELHAGTKLEAAAHAIAEEYCDSSGFSAGPFGPWRTVLLPFDELEQVASQMRRLDRLARDADGARAFEEGWHERWELTSDIMTN